MEKAEFREPRNLRLDDHADEQLGRASDTETVPAEAGYGACKGCGCTGFRGKGGSTSTYICECGHHYSLHRPT